ncbi:MAG: RsmB/NOP family class I SAM-dependent RNA methyltransferase [Opitutaceae bacterium]|nr:RsmB/NOP family class I SAM-dependent RNA methyltransferase [Opitutaceae bacterium]
MNPRILENQRRTLLALIRALEPQLVPGRPFAAEIRSELARHDGFGSRDRRLYRELIYTWLRYRPWFDRARAKNDAAAADLFIALSGDAPEVATLHASLSLPEGRAFARRPGPALFEQLRVLIPDVPFEPRELLPSWFESHCPALLGEAELACHLTRPPFWLRAQRGTGLELVQELGRTGIEATASTRLPAAVRVNSYVDLEKHPLVEQGRAEVQDIGSQALLMLVAPQTGSRWLDLCAGAGGKSLQLATLLGPSGRVHAHDIRRDALMELRRRAHRAGLKNIEIEGVLPDEVTARFDGVLVDAPCSGSGTWRRHPFLIHQTTPTQINTHARTQATLLRRGANYVAPGGRLVYATCSLSRRENEEVVTAFVKEFPEFTLEAPAPVAGLKPEPAGWLTILPSALDSDGYFLACLRRS